MNDLDVAFEKIRKDVFLLVKEKDIDIRCLAFDLGVNTDEFMNNFDHRIDDFYFYIAALDLAENWEG